MDSPYAEALGVWLGVRLLSLLLVAVIVLLVSLS
jgi:hypothetical protein